MRRKRAGKRQKSGILKKRTDAVTIRVRVRTRKGVGGVGSGFGSGSERVNGLGAIGDGEQEGETVVGLFYETSHLDDSINGGK